MARRDELSDAQWATLKPLFPPPPTRSQGKGRPRVQDDRSVLNGVVWVLRMGTCYRRFSHWVKTGTLRLVLEALAQHLEQSKNIDLSECFIDGTFSYAKKGRDKVGKTKGGKGSKVMALVTKKSRPLAISVFSATPFESTLFEETIKNRFTRTRIWRVVADRAYDSDTLDKRLKKALN